MVDKVICCPDLFFKKGLDSCFVVRKTNLPTSSISTWMSRRNTSPEVICFLVWGQHSGSVKSLAVRLNWSCGDRPHSMQDSSTEIWLLSAVCPSPYLLLSLTSVFPRKNLGWPASSQLLSPDHSAMIVGMINMKQKPLLAQVGSFH